MEAERRSRQMNEEDIFEKQNKKNHREVREIFGYLEEKLPAGWKMNEGGIKIRHVNRKTMIHTYCKGEDG